MAHLSYLESLEEEKAGFAIHFQDFQRIGAAIPAIKYAQR